MSFSDRKNYISAEGALNGVIDLPTIFFLYVSKKKNFKFNHLFLDVRSSPVYILVLCLSKAVLLGFSRKSLPCCLRLILIFDQVHIVFYGIEGAPS